MVALESIGGSVLNFLIIVALLRSPNMRKEYLTPFIISMSLADFALSVFNLPFLSLRFFMRKWPGIHCPTFGFVGLWLYVCSAWNLLGVALIRCVVIYRNKMTSTKFFQWSTKILPLVTWIIPFLTLLPTLLGKYGRFVLLCEIQICRIINVDENEDPLPFKAEENLSSILIYIGVILIILNLATYARVAFWSRKLANQLKDVNQNIAKEVLEKERKVGIMMGVVIIIFLITFLSGFIRTIDRNFPSNHPNIQSVLWLMAYSIVILDPLVYIVFQDQYRKEVGNLLKEIGGGCIALAQGKLCTLF